MSEKNSISSTTGSTSGNTGMFANKTEAKLMKSAGFWQAYTLGIGIALGGFSSTWTAGMECGIWEGFSSLMVLFVGFLMLNMCLSEMCSAVAFAGGSYGYVRCSIGPFYGFLAACTEVVQYMIYTVYAVKKIAAAITQTELMPESYEPIWALIAYLTITGLHCKGGGYFWNVMIGLTILTVAIILVYFFGSLTVVDIAHAGGVSQHGVYEDLKCFSKNFEYFFLCYMGVCALPLTASRIQDVSIFHHFLKFLLHALIFCFDDCFTGGESDSQGNCVWYLHFVCICNHDLLCECNTTTRFKLQCTSVVYLFVWISQLCKCSIEIWKFICYYPTLRIGIWLYVCL